MVTINLSAIANTADPLRQSRIGGDDGAAISQRAEILCRIKTECAGEADRADWPAIGRGQVRLAAVFDERNSILRSHTRQPVHVSGLTIEMHRQDRARSRGNGSYDGRSVNRQRLRFDVR